MTAAKRIGHSHVGVIVAVDPQRCRGLAANARHNIRQFSGEYASVGVAKHQAVGAGLCGAAYGLQRVVGVGPEPVEEVLGVVEHGAAVALEVGHGIGDHGQVLLQGGLQHFVYVEVGALAHQRNDRRFGRHESPHVAVVLHADACATRAAERCDLGVGERQALDSSKVFGVLGVGAGPSALYVVHAQFVQSLRNLDLVLGREGNPLLLSAVPQRCVV